MHPAHEEVSPVRFTNTVTVDRPPSDVFAYLAEFEHVPEWNYAIVETEKTSPGPIGVGTTYRQVRSIPTRSEESFTVTRFEPGRRLAIRGTIGPFEGDLTYELREEAGSTVLTNDADLRGRGPTRLAGPLLAGRVKDAVAENLRVLKRILEGSGRSG